MYSGRIGALRAVLFVLAVFFLSSCSFFRGPKEERRLSVLRPVAPEIKTLPVSIPASKLETAVGDKGSLYALRAIEVYTGPGQAVPAYPRYKLFDIAPQSAYALGGLRNGDILTGIDGLVVVNPAVLPQVFSVLSKTGGAEFEVQRGIDNYLVKLTVVAD